MGIKKFGTRGKVLTNRKFFLLLNYLDSFGIKNYNKGRTERKIGKDKTTSLINWVEFDLQPTQLSTTYKILLIHVQNYAPYVYILSPSLENLKKEGEKIPHLYDPNRYRLCLYYPHTNDYNFNEEIGQQFIPWILHWLYYFEEWLYSNNWKGGGVEPGDEIDRQFNPKYNKNNLPEKEDSIINTTAIDEANKIYDRRMKKLLKEQESEDR